MEIQMERCMHLHCMSTMMTLILLNISLMSYSVYMSLMWYWVCIHCYIEWCMNLLIKLKILPNNLEMEHWQSLEMYNIVRHASEYLNQYCFQFQAAHNYCLQKIKEIHLIKCKVKNSFHQQRMMLIFLSLFELEKTINIGWKQFQVAHQNCIRRSKEIHLIKYKLNDPIPLSPKLKRENTKWMTRSSCNRWCWYSSKSYRYLNWKIRLNNSVGTNSKLPITIVSERQKRSIW